MNGGLNRVRVVRWSETCGTRLCFHSRSRAAIAYCASRSHRRGPCTLRLEPFTLNSEDRGWPRFGLVASNVQSIFQAGNRPTNCDVLAVSLEGIHKSVLAFSEWPVFIFFS